MQHEKYFGTSEFNKIFNSIDLKHQIKISLIDDVAWFNINKIEYDSFKTFLLLLKDVITFMSKNGIKYIKQCVEINDLELFKYSTWFESSEDIYTINTKIEDFMPEIINIFGIKTI